MLGYPACLYILMAAVSDISRGMHHHSARGSCRSYLSQQSTRFLRPQSSAVTFRNRSRNYRHPLGQVCHRQLSSCMSAAAARQTGSRQTGCNSRRRSFATAASQSAPPSTTSEESRPSLTYILVSSVLHASSFASLPCPNWLFACSSVY